MALVIFATKIYAQEDYRTVMFYEAPYLFNPAFAGHKHDFALTLSTRQEEVHNYNQRKTYMFGYDQDIPAIKMALGLTGYYHDASSYLSQKRWAVGIHLAYKFQLKNGAIASVGSRVNLTHIDLDYSKIPYPSNPPNGTTYGSLRTLPYFKSDVDMGVGYAQGEFLAGVSLSHSNNPKWELGAGYPSFYLNRRIQFMSLYTFSVLNDQFQLRPALWLNSHQNLMELMPSISLGYKKMIFIGFDYYIFDHSRNNNFPYDFGLHTTFSFKEKIKLGIQYEHLRKVLYQGNYYYPSTLYPVYTTDKKFANFEIHISYQLPHEEEEEISTNDL